MLVTVGCKKASKEKLVYAGFKGVWIRQTLKGICRQKIPKSRCSENVGLEELSSAGFLKIGHTFVINKFIIFSNNTTLND